MDKHFPDSDGVIGLHKENQGVVEDPKTGFYAGVALVGQKFLKRYPNRKLFCPLYFLFAAQEVTKLAINLEKIRMAKNAKFKHFSPNKIPGAMDRTHKEGRKWKPVDRALRWERGQNGIIWGDKI
jgi:hypothetical protein